MLHIVGKLKRKRFKNGKECNEFGSELKFWLSNNAKSLKELFPWTTWILNSYNFFNTHCVWKNE